MLFLKAFERTIDQIARLVGVWETRKRAVWWENSEGSEECGGGSRENSGWGKKCEFYSVN